MPAPLRPCLFLLAPTCASLLYMKSVFVTGYALCLFATSCVFPRRCVPFLCLFVSAVVLQAAPSLLFPAPACAYLLHMKSVFVTGYALCLFLTSCDFPWLRTRPPPVCLPVAADEAAHPQAHPSTSTHAERGPVSRPPLYPLYGPDVTACRTRSPKLRCLPVPSGAVACSTGS